MSPTKCGENRFFGHSGARLARTGISRFRVRCCASPRNDGSSSLTSPPNKLHQAAMSSTTAPDGTWWRRRLRRARGSASAVPRSRACRCGATVPPRTGCWRLRRRAPPVRARWHKRSAFPRRASRPIPAPSALPGPTRPRKQVVKGTIGIAKRASALMALAQSTPSSVQ